MTNNEIDDIKPGQVFSNDEIRAVFGGFSRGGIRPSNKTDSIILISNHVDSIYEDRWDGDILYYTGAGRKGDQKLKHGNKSLYDSKENKKPIFLFEVFSTGEYIYIGKAVLAGSLLEEIQPDEDGNSRKVYVFPLKLADNTEKVETIRERIVKELFDEGSLDFKTLGDKDPKSYDVKTRQFKRDIRVIAFARRKANGTCQLCEKDAPFKDKEEIPYLEVHHINWLSAGGSDTIDNIIALCPNCHRKMHVVKDQNDIAKLKGIAQNFAEAALEKENNSKK